MKSSDFKSRAWALVRRTHRHEQKDEDAIEQALRDAYNAGQNDGVRKCVAICEAGIRDWRSLAGVKADMKKLLEADT